jgi:hypothetical protein
MSPDLCVTCTGTHVWHTFGSIQQTASDARSKSREYHAGFEFHSSKVPAQDEIWLMRAVSRDGLDGSCSEFWRLAYILELRRTEHRTRRCHRLKSQADSRFNLDPGALSPFYDISLKLDFVRTDSTLYDDRNSVRSTLVSALRYRNDICTDKKANQRKTVYCYGVRE